MATVSEEMVALKELVFKLDKRISDELQKRRPSTDAPTTDISSVDNDEEEQDNALDHEGQDLVEEDTKSRFFEISESSKTFLQAAFCRSRPVDNKTRREWLGKFATPEGDEIRCPKIDTVIKAQLPKECVEADRKLSKLQNFSLDAAGPLVMALEEATRDDGIHDMDLITNCIQQALLSLGNASAMKGE